MNTSKTTRVFPQDIPTWKRATKTKAIKAKPLITLFLDRSVLSKFLINTLEGIQSLDERSMVCLGDSNDVWQQMPKKLIAKYNVIDVDADGWMICEPRPDNAVNCFEVGESALPEGEKQFYIIGQWGNPTPEGARQDGEAGDFVCQSTIDANDVWIVKRKVFLNTYSVLS